MASGENTLLVHLRGQRRVVEERIRDGSYASADEAIRAPLRDFDRSPECDKSWLLKLAGE